MIHTFRLWRKSWAHKMNRPWIRLLAWLELLIIDHGLFRALYNTPEEVVDGLWRSNQPSPWRLRRLANQGFRTVVSLRGGGTDGPWLLEKEACERHGLTLFSLRMKSNRAPSRTSLQELVQVVREAERPLLVHCKSGADRSGLAAAVFLLDQSPPRFEEARAQLHWRYLHSRTARTGILDAFIEAYEAFYRQQPVEFSDWLDHHYDPKALSGSFRPRGLSSWLVDRVLRRE